MAPSTPYPNVAVPNTAPQQGELFPHEYSWRQGLAEAFRTRLTAIIGFSELLGSEKLSSNGRHDLDQVLKAARELLDVVDHRLEVRPTEKAATSGGNQLREQRCDLLYIEDDIANAALIKRTLEVHPGLLFKHATHGRHGIKLAKTENPKLILLDLNLPDVNGAEVLDALQATPETSNIPVIVLSANASGSQIERLLAAGARNYLTKPFKPDHFLAVVDEWLRPPVQKAGGVRPG